VTQESPTLRPTIHPDPALIAAHVDRRLTGDEAARMDAHIAGCQDCYEIYTETVRFGLAEEEAEGVRRTAVRAGEWARRSRFLVTAGLAAAAALVLGVGLFFLRVRAPGTPGPLVAELARSIGDRRFIEPRLTGGFQYGRLVILRSAEAPKGLDAQPPAVLAAVAHIREKAEGDTSPDALGALAATYLVSGDVAAAVQALESATSQKPDDPRLLSDLAAALLVRAARTDEPADIPKALESAERAIVLKDAPTEAWFNRALALERLHLTDAAKKAWQDYLDRDATSGWADEARQHLETLRSIHQTSAEEESARARAAVEAGQEAIDHLANDSPSSLRAYFEDEILPAWANAHLVGHPDEARYREIARLLGDALLRSTGDAMPRDAALALADPPHTAAAHDPLRTQAVGYRTLHEANRLYDRQEPACSPYRSAARDLAAGCSPFAGMARLQRVSTCLFASDHATALAELGRLESLAAPHGYTQLLGRVLWMQGLLHGYDGRLVDSLVAYRSAQAAFRKMRDADREASMLAAAAEDLILQGEGRRSWRDRERGLALLGRVRNVVRRHKMLAEATWACLDERTPRSALHFEAALVETAIGSSREGLISGAFTRRAATLHMLSSDDAAVSDLAAARRSIARMPDAAWAAKEAAEVDALEGEVLTPGDPEAAARTLSRAQRYFEATEPLRVPALHLLRARAQLAAGLDHSAEEELQKGIQLLEQSRVSLHEVSVQLSFFDQVLPFFEDMVRLQVAKRHDPERALAFVERGHARQLVDSLSQAASDPFDPASLRRRLPVGLALVYYLSLDDRVYMWSLSHEGIHFIERPLSSMELSRLVAANQAAILRRAPLEVVRRTAARLHDELVHPFIPFIGSARALVFIPDGVLQSVAFAALWNPDSGRYLVEDHMVGVAPSGTVFVEASDRAARFKNGSGALVVGNPLVDRRLGLDLPDLPGAEAEAVEIARLYPTADLLTGKRATIAAFLANAKGRSVVHYAGHATASNDAPSAARLLFAPDAQAGDSGSLSLQKLDRRDFADTNVVVLAACRTAAGPVSRVEGALSLGRPFLAARVTSVVASLWDVDDALSHRFFVAFHQALAAEGDSLSALRKAQMNFIHGQEPLLAHPESWAGFISLGGLDPRSLSKGELS
jgi:CHAT domain-containing protein